MLIKLSTGHEINPDRIDWILPYIPEDDLKFSAGAQIGSRMFDLIPEDYEVIRAYHEGKSVGETREQINKRMEEAKREAERAEERRKMREFRQAFCDRCEHGPSICQKECVMSFDASGDCIEIVAGPSLFSPKKAEVTKPFTVQDLPKTEPSPEMKAIEELANQHIEKMRQVCSGCSRRGSEMCIPCWKTEDMVIVPTQFKAGPEKRSCSDCRYGLAKTLHDWPCRYCGIPVQHKHWTPRA